MIDQIETNILPAMYIDPLQFSMYKSNREYIERRHMDSHQNISIFRDTQTQRPTNIKYRNNIEYVNNNANQQPESLDRFRSIRCYISLTTNPSRFYTDDFIEVLKCLSNQTVLPDKIYVSVCSKYVRKFTNFRTDSEHAEYIEYIKDRFPLVEIIEGVVDHGPATKLLGLLEFNKKTDFLKENDLIIVTDDDMLYSNDLVASHMTCYQLYNCDIIAVNEDTMIRTWHPYTFNASDIFYLDQYEGFLYGWLSFAVTYRAIKIKNDIEQFHTNIVKKFPDVFYHDDLLFSLYMYVNKLHTVENRFITLFHEITHEQSKKRVTMSKNLAYIDARTSIDSISPLRNLLLGSGITKFDLEKMVYQYFDITLIGKSYRSRQVEYVIQNSIPCRDLVLVDNVKIILCPDDIHISFVYLDDQTAILTVTVFNDTMMQPDIEIIFSIGDIQYSVIINIEKHSTGIINKFSHLLYFVNILLSPKPHSNPRNLTVMQTNSSTQMTMNRFNSISTLLVNSPEFPYQFFDDTNVMKFVADNYTNIVYDAINNLNPGAYVGDVFRYCYLYLNGGVYMDCKKVVYIPLSNYIDNFADLHMSSKITDIFVKDRLKNYSYNAIMVCDKFSKVMKITLVYSIYKIIKNSYDKDPLSVTGPGCLGDAIDYMYGDRYPYYYFNKVPVIGYDWLSFVEDTMGHRVIKNTYFGYYDEGAYRTTGHYHNLWHQHNIYKKNLSSKYKNIKKMTDIVLFRL
jgi:hypothetical protein